MGTKRPQTTNLYRNILFKYIITIKKDRGLNPCLSHFTSFTNLYILTHSFTQ
ncbi:MAG: hypothetical protein ACKPKO_63190 [Candidatus Fonsibacter sp.]